MANKKEQEYARVFREMADQAIFLASRIVGDAVKRGTPYLLACHAVKVAAYQGLFATVLQSMKCDGKIRSNLKINEAFGSVEDHRDVCYEVIQLMFDHLQVLDRRHIWSVNVARRQLRPGEKPKNGFLPE
jgi:hypothetical protein